MLRTLIMTVGVVAAAAALGFGAVYFMSEARLRDAARGSAFDAAIPSDAASLERGRHIARTRGCFGCHGQQLEGKDFGEQWDWPERAVAPNLAAYARAHDAATMEAAIRQGIGADGRALMAMPSFNFTRLTDDDTAALIAFLRSAPVTKSDLPEAKLGWSVRFDLARGAETTMTDWVRAVPALRVDAAAEPERARGEYLAMTMCNECHGLDVRGQMLFGPPTPDLAMVAAISRADFERLITTGVGVGVGGRELGLMGLVAPDRFPALTSEEIDALYAYLVSLAGEPAAPDVFWRPAP
ncbi:c-type cytochrome [Hyphococcus sp.]|uniref:c-type cytochrome n=1 Tax=Hyphococcus sp. TaxID=2038636 RepID=UPI003CCC31E5